MKRYPIILNKTGNFMYRYAIYKFINTETELLIRDITTDIIMCGYMNMACILNRLKTVELWLFNNSYFELMKICLRNKSLYKGGDLNNAHYTYSED